MPIDCWRDKLPNGRPVQCGNFDSWDQFLKMDGEKFCKTHCPPGYKGKPSKSGSYLRSNKKWIDSLCGKPVYRQKVRGRKIC